MKATIYNTGEGAYWTPGCGRELLSKKPQNPISQEEQYVLHIIAKAGLKKKDIPLVEIVLKAIQQLEKEKTCPSIKQE